MHLIHTFTFGHFNTNTFDCTTECEKRLSLIIRTTFIFFAVSHFFLESYAHMNRSTITKLSASYYANNF